MIMISAERLKQLEYIESNYDSIVEQSVMDILQKESQTKRAYTSNRAYTNAHSDTRANIPMIKYLSTATTATATAII